MIRQNLYSFSFWCKEFKLNGTLALFHSLSLFVIYFSEVVAGEIIEFRKLGLFKEREYFDNLFGRDVVEILMRERLLVNQFFDFDEERLVLANKLKEERFLNVMYLLVTDGCNFKCSYCFEETPKLKSSFLESYMTEEIVDKAIQKFARLTKKYGSDKKKRFINIYGGEPLLNMDIVCYAIVEINKAIDRGCLPKKTEIIVITNGSLVTDNIAKFFASNNVSVGISIDGPREINNEFRISKNRNKDPFMLARRGHKILSKYNVNTGVSATITPTVIKNKEKVLKFFVKDIDVRNGMSFNILHHSPLVEVDENYYLNAAIFLIDAFDIFRSIGIYEERMVRKTSAFIDQEQIYADCGVVGNQIIVSPDGKIGICQDFIKPRDYFRGSVLDDDYDPIKDGLFIEWENRSPLFMEECFECESIALCGGGCPASVELSTGNRWNIDKRICFHSKLSLEWLIWETYKGLE